LKGDRQREMLELAEKHGWTSTDLRARVRDALRGEKWKPDE
jgi:hypothetical protein